MTSIVIDKAGLCPTHSLTKKNYVNCYGQKIFILFSGNLWARYCIRRSLLPKRERKEKFANGWPNLFGGRSTRFDYFNANPPSYLTFSVHLWTCLDPDHKDQAQEKNPAAEK